MFCENCGAELQDPIQKFCSNCGTPLRKKIVLRYNDELNEYQELGVDEDVQIRELLDSDFILLFVDSKRYRIWIWHGSNTTTRMKFIAAKLAPSIRDRYGIGFKITAVDEGNETLGFKIFAGLEEEIDYDEVQKGPTYEGTQKDLELLESLSREKILLLLEKAGVPEGYERKMEIVNNKIYGYKEYDRDYLGSIIKEKQLFPLKIGFLLNGEYIYATLEKLSKGPIPLEWLREWFIEEFPEKDFEEIIDTLVDKQFIFINQIGLAEKYVLLLKEVKVKRIPPVNVIEIIKDNSELNNILLTKIQEYFSEYKMKSVEEIKEDSKILYQIIIDPNKNNILSILRNGLISKEKLLKLVSKKALNSLIENIKFLKQNDVIEEFYYNMETFIVLKTDIQITTSIPNFLERTGAETVQDNKNDDDDSGYITPFPHFPPGSPGAAGIAKRKILPTEMKVNPELKPYCKHCGAELPKGQSICHVCGKRVG